MRRPTYTGERETWLDHLVAGIISALAMLLTAALGPVVASLMGGGTSPTGIFFAYRAIHVWGAILIAVAFATGLVLGPRRVAELYGHLWGTEQPKNEGLTVGLWLGILAIVGVSYWLS